MGLLEYAAAPATTRAQAQLQYELSASGPFALPPASPDENQSRAGLDSAGRQYILHEFCRQTLSVRAASHSVLWTSRSTDASVATHSTRKHFLGFSN